MQMRDLLICTLAYGMPYAHSLIWKCGGNSARNARNRGHECPTRFIVQLADVVEVSARHYQGMARVKLPKIDGSQGEFVLPDNARWLGAPHNLTE
jgi:hypothetical protein